MCWLGEGGREGNNGGRWVRFPGKAIFERISSLSIPDLIDSLATPSNSDDCHLWHFYNQWSPVSSRLSLPSFTCRFTCLLALVGLHTYLLADWFVPLVLSLLLLLVFSVSFPLLVHSRDFSIQRSSENHLETRSRQEHQGNWNTLQPTNRPRIRPVVICSFLYLDQAAKCTILNISHVMYPRSICRKSPSSTFSRSLGHESNAMCVL